MSAISKKVCQAMEAVTSQSGYDGTHEPVAHAVLRVPEVFYALALRRIISTLTVDDNGRVKVGTKVVDSAEALLAALKKKGNLR